MTWGIVCPRLLLPDEAIQWSAQRRRVVLLHELGHVARWDCLAEWVSRIAIAVYWFHPLLWLAGVKMRGERERACDDLVLRCGHSACSYAEHLLEVAAAANPRVADVAIAMARTSEIEMRLQTILDERINRRALTLAAAVACIATACGLVLSLAMVRAATPMPAASGATTAVKPSPATRPASQPNNAAADEDGPEHKYVLRAIDEQGKPIAGVKLWVDKDFPDWPLCNANENRRDKVVQTSDDGTAIVDFPQVKTNIVATKKDYAPTLLRGATLPAGKPLDVRLRVGQKISGRIRDERNRPIAGAKVRATRQRFILDYLPDFVLTATSDADGRFEMEHAVEGPYQLLARLEEGAVPMCAEPAVVQVPVDRAPPLVEMIVHAGARIRGRFETAHPLPLGGRRISVFCRLPKSSIWETTSEPDGSFVIDGIPVGAKGQISFTPPRGYVAEASWTPLPPLCAGGTNQLEFNQLTPMTHDGVVVRLLKEAVATGTLRDEQGKPYVKADVIVEQTNRVYFTDSAGKFSAPIPPMTDATLRLSAKMATGTFENFQPKVGPIRAEEGTTVHKDLVFRRKSLPAHDNELSGRVVDGQGNAVAGARVYLANYGIVPIEVVNTEWARTTGTTLKWKGGQFYPAELTADNEGRFSFNLLRDGKTDVFAEREGAQWDWIRDVATNTKDVKLVLRPMPDDATFNGTVEDDTGAALPGVHVMVYSGDYFRGGELGATDTDGKGAYSLRIHPRPEDKTCVRLVCRRSDGSIAWRTLPSCGGDDIHIRFKPAAIVRGRVVDKGRGTVPGATVWCDLERDPNWGELMLTRKTLPLSPRATTDADGRFELRGLPAGSEATLFATHPDFEQGERWYVENIGPKTDIGNLELPDGISISGSVKFAADGRPGTGVSVWVVDPFSLDRQVPTTADAQGRFTLKGLTKYMFNEIPVEIRAESRDGEWAGKLEYPNHLYSGDHVAGVEILLKQSPDSQHRQWLARPGKPVASKFLAAVFDDVDPAREGKKAYHDTLTVYDSAGQVAWDHNDLNFGYGVAAVQSPSDGLLWAYQNQARCIQAFTPQGKPAWKADAENVDNMAADPQSGNVWVLCYGGKSGGFVEIRNPAGAVQRRFDASGSEIAYSPAGRCFWLAGRKVQRFDADGKLVSEAPLSFAFGARGMAVNPQDGTVWVIEGKHPQVYGSLNRILILSPDGQVLKEMDLGDTYGLSIALDTVRRVAWVQAGEGIRRISFDGQTLSELPVQGHVCIEPDTGCAWVASRTGVYRIDPDGRCLWAKESPVQTEKQVFIMER